MPAPAGDAVSDGETGSEAVRTCAWIRDASRAGVTVRDAERERPCATVASPSGTASSEAGAVSAPAADAVPEGEASSAAVR